MSNTCSYKFQICSAKNQLANEKVKKTSDFLGSPLIVSDLVSAQIDKITRVPGIIENAGKETPFEKFSIP